MKINLASKWFETAKQIRTCESKSLFVCVCVSKDTTSFCNFSCKHHFEHSENIVKADVGEEFFEGDIGYHLRKGLHI